MNYCYRKLNLVFDQWWASSACSARRRKILDVRANLSKGWRFCFSSNPMKCKAMHFQQAWESAQAGGILDPPLHPINESSA
jgi:hypothetical protein